MINVVDRPTSIVKRTILKTKQNELKTKKWYKISSFKNLIIFQMNYVCSLRTVYAGLKATGESESVISRNENQVHVRTHTIHTDSS